MRILGGRLDVERAFHVNGINKHFHGYAKATNSFHGYALVYIRSRAEKESFVRQSSFKAVAVEEVTDS
jgi:hypothetical protein